jgi:GNAT superfamily N-acetyltransferase
LARRVEVTITYLEQRARPVLQTPRRPPLKVAILRAESPPAHFYRYMYGIVGDPYNWVSRKRLSDPELTEIIHDPAVHLYILYAQGAPAGLAEVDARDGKIVDLKFFGLAREFHGRGFGRYFLANVIDLCWSLAPERVRLETCTLDHPAALPLYQKLGFTVFDQRKGEVELPDEQAS